MTAHEKAVTALNRRLERLQAMLKDEPGEAAQEFLIQSILVTVGLGEELNDYIKSVGGYAQRRYGELKATNDALAVRHAELLNSGKALLDRLKATPSDRTLRKEIEAAQKSMESIQKTLRRGANQLEREVAPAVALVDKLADTLRRFGEADGLDGLKRVVKAAIGQAGELQGELPSAPAKDLIDSGLWEASAMSEIDDAADFHDAYARAGYQAWLAAHLMTMALSENPPLTADEAMRRANAFAAARAKEIAARLTAP